MHISDKLANENWERNQNWTTKPTTKNSTSAMFAFAGEVYRGLDVKTLDKNAVDFLQKNLRMLSGLYGFIEAFGQNNAIQAGNGLRLQL